MRIPKLASGAGLVLLGSAVLAACEAEEPEVAEVETEAPAVAPGAAPATAPPVTAAALPAGVTPEMVQQGQQIYSGPGICFTCHGQNAEGTALAPSLRDDQWLWITPGENMYQELVTVIKTGVSQPKEHPAPMPAMGGAQLSEDQIQAVAAYVYSLAHGA